MQVFTESKPSPVKQHINQPQSKRRAGFSVAASTEHVPFSKKSTQKSIKVLQETDSAPVNFVIQPKTQRERRPGFSVSGSVHEPLVPLTQSAQRINLLKEEILREVSSQKSDETPKPKKLGTQILEAFKSSHFDSIDSSRSNGTARKSRGLDSQFNMPKQYF